MCKIHFSKQTVKNQLTLLLVVRDLLLLVINNKFFFKFSEINGDRFFDNIFDLMQYINLFYTIEVKFVHVVTLFIIKEVMLS